MLYWLLLWVLVAASVLLTAKILPGVEVKGWGSALVAAAVLGGLNVLVKPLLILLTLPLTVLTLGLFLLVVNAIILGLTAYIVPGFRVKGFWAAIFASLIISLCTTLGTAMLERSSLPRSINSPELNEEPPQPTNWL